MSAEGSEPSFEGLPADQLADLVSAQLAAGGSPFDDVVLPNRLAMVTAWLLLYFADEDARTPDALRPILRRVGFDIEARRRGDTGDGVQNHHL